MMQFVSPPGWRRAKGYSHAVRIDNRIVIAGVLPVDPASFQVVSEDFSEQWSRALRNVGEILAAEGVPPTSVIALRVYVTSIEAYKSASAALGSGWTEVFGRHFPAITLVEVSKLIDDDAMLEIEAEAVVGSSA